MLVARYNDAMSSNVVHPFKIKVKLRISEFGLSLKLIFALCAGVLMKTVPIFGESLSDIATYLTDNFQPGMVKTFCIHMLMYFRVMTDDFEDTRVALVLRRQVVLCLSIVLRCSVDGFPVSVVESVYSLEIVVKDAFHDGGVAESARCRGGGSAVLLDSGAEDGGHAAGCMRGEETSGRGYTGQKEARRNSRRSEGERRGEK
ncbi:hypothetical protein Tco_0599035 [Tanacetum coccineum]